MRVYHDNSMPRCQWDECQLEAATQVFNEDMTDNIFVCCEHKKVVAINLEKHDRLRVSQSSNNLSTQKPGIKDDVNIVRPGENNIKDDVKKTSIVHGISDMPTRRRD